MGDAPQPVNKGAWTDLEQGFFAGAPPEVPATPPAPMRFDDLEPIPTPRVERRLRQRRALDIAPAERAELRPLIVRAGARCVPLISWVRARVRARAPRLSAVARAKVGEALRLSLNVAVRKTRALATRVIAAIPTNSADRWMVASLAALFVLVGVSAVVIASRGGARSTLPTTTMTVPRRVATPVVVTREPAVWPEPPPPASEASPIATPRSIAPAPAGAAAPARTAAPTPSRNVAVKRHRHHRKLARTHVGSGEQKRSRVPAASKVSKVSKVSKAIAPATPVRPAPARPTSRATFTR